MRHATNGTTKQTKQIVSVKEARKLLGHNARLMSDSQIEYMVALLTAIADSFLQDEGSKVH